MRKYILLLALAAVPVFAQKGERLFNGKNLEGWKFAQPGPEGFVVEDGVLHTQDGKGMMWFTRKKIGNATLRVVYKMSNEKGNSGVFIRIPIEPTSENDAINKGIEVQIDNQDNDWHCTGVLYSMTKAKARPYKPAGEWNTLEITMKGPRTIVKLNGVLVTDYDGVSPVPPKKGRYEPERGPRPDSGYIAIQHHGGAATVWFREISLVPGK
jgi:hypothetical protein